MCLLWFLLWLKVLTEPILVGVLLQALLTSGVLAWVWLVPGLFWCLACSGSCSGGGGGGGGGCGGGGGAGGGGGGPGPQNH